MTPPSRENGPSPEAMYAVLTGDLVSSSALNSQDRRKLLTALEDAVRQAKLEFPDTVHSTIDIFRGDSWQLVLTDPVRALRIGLFLRAVIRAAPGLPQPDTRLSIGYGPVEYLPEGDISTGGGPAFSLSGSGLKNAWKICRMVLIFPASSRSRITRALNIIVRLIDLQVTHWTARQTEAVSGALLDLTQDQIGQGWMRDQVSQQAISQHLDGAGWIKIKSSLEFTEEVLPELIPEMQAVKL